MNHDIEKALDNLEKRAQDIQHYMNIMSKVKTVNVADDQDFQREFDFFYKVRRNAEWRKVFFEIFERKKKKNCSYKEIITELYEGTGQVEASFASKMLASIDENMPIWDSKVLDRIGIKSSNKRGQQKLEETIELYDVIVQWYSDLKANKASYNGWRKLLKDDSERLLLLEEAVNLHNSGCYYGATSIMMCQVDGLICDISNYTDENGLICSEDDEKEICELYQVDFQNHKKFAKKSEKHMILRLAAMTENAVFYWEAMTDYIYNVVLTSHGEEYRDHNPLRNKICHGDQLDFGTEEKSLKSIFVIDLLLNLKSEMQWLAERKFDK